MKLKGISNQGIRRLAQVVADPAAEVSQDWTVSDAKVYKVDGQDVGMTLMFDNGYMWYYAIESSEQALLDSSGQNAEGFMTGEWENAEGFMTGEWEDAYGPMMDVAQTYMGSMSELTPMSADEQTDFNQKMRQNYPVDGGSSWGLF